MTDELNEIRALLSELPPRGRGRRYPSELRARVVAYTKRRRAQHATMHVIGRELGISENTIGRWCAAKAAPEPPTFVPVRLQSPRGRLTLSDEPRLTLDSGRGWRITGLSVADVAELLRGTS